MAAPPTLDAVVRSLSDAVSANEALRVPANQTLMKWESASGFASMLLEVFGNQVRHQR